MLTEHEEKLIQRYYIYPKIAITAVIMALALGVPFILLEMIDDLVFHDDVVRHLEMHRGEVPDGLNAALQQLITDLLGVGRGHGDDADMYLHPPT